MTQFVYATSNPGKLAEVQKIARHHNLNILGLTDFGIDVDIDEVGLTLEDNAKIKAEAYLKLLPKDTVVISDDTGIEIDALGGEPGIKVRRWKGYKMEDEEILEYCLKRLENVPHGSRGAQFRTVLAVGMGDKPLKYFDGILRGEILVNPRLEREKGMPFWPIFYLPKLKMTLGEFHATPLDFQMKNPTHRELAVISALPFLATLVN